VISRSDEGGVVVSVSFLPAVPQLYTHRLLALQPLQSRFTIIHAEIDPLWQLSAAIHMMLDLCK
jgi:hypothetical protein